MSKQVDFLQNFYAKAKVHTETQGNYTLVELSFRGQRAFGIAKRNPTCVPLIPDRGYQIAYARALRSLDAKLKDARPAGFLERLLG